MQSRNLNMFLILLIAGSSVRAQFNEKIFDIPNVKEKNISLYGYNRFRDKLPFEVKDSTVIFYLRGHKEAQRVFLSGSFCNWSPELIRMEKKEGGWVTKVKLGAGKHLYKFIVDGNWEHDSDNLLSEVNEHASFNSVYYKTNIVFRLRGFSKVKRVFLGGSFNNWRATELPLNKTESGWEIPLYLSAGSYTYKFKADNRWLEDPANPKKLSDKLGGINSLINVGGSIVDKNLAYYQNELAIHERSGSMVNIVDDLVNLGNAYMKLHDRPNAIQNFQKAIPLYEKFKNFSGKGDMLLNIASAYRELSDFPRLLEYLQKARKEYEKSGNEYGLARTMRQMGYYYLNLPFYPNALEFFLKALNLYEGLNKPLEKATVLGDLGHTYLLIKDDDKGWLYLQKAFTLNQQISNKNGMAHNLWILGGYHLNRLHDVPAALECYRKAQRLFEETDNKVKVAYVLFGLADLYLEAPDSALARAGINVSQKFNRSIDSRKKGLEIIKKLQPESEQLWPLSSLADTYEKAGRYDTAYLYYKQSVSLREKIVGTEKQKEIARLETKYEYEKKQDSLQLRQDLTDENLQKQLLLFTQQQQAFQLNRTQLALANKEKELQHLAFLKTQSDLENEQLIKQQKEKQNNLQSVQLKSLTQKNAIIQLNQQRQWVFIIGGFLLLVMASFFFIYRSRLRSVQLETQLVKEKAAQEKKETEFQHKLADISMSALRSQMNPHFIFNCLNSIKLYTTENNTLAATEYLTKFSKLIRLVLENSRNERITLSSELAALELYVEMEAMRFKEKLSYTFNVDKDVETEYIDIPPLLLQPYVENAIWHGLMPKDEGGHLDINVSMQERESLLEINITDSGVGRLAAKALNDKIGSKHRSYGMKATKERIALINQIYRKGANVIVHDLVDDEGQAAGTQVTLQIPV